MLRGFGPGAYRILAQSAVAVNLTGSTSETVLATIPIPANTIGTNGLLRIWTTWTCNNDADDKIPRIRLGGISGAIIFSQTLTTMVAATAITVMQNRNAANSQYSTSLVARGTDGLVTTVATGATAADTATALDLVITGQLESATTDNLQLEGYVVELSRA